MTDDEKSDDQNATADEATTSTDADEQETRAADDRLDASRERKADAVMSVPVGVCARHVHLSQAHLAALFGKDHQLIPLCDLSQPGEFAALEVVSVRGPAGTLENVRVVGPTSAQTQVELPLRDCEQIGTAMELKLTRQTAGTTGCVLEGPVGTVVLADGVLNALRHLRINAEEAKRLNLAEGDRVRFRVGGDRSRVIQDVVVGVEDGVLTELVLEGEEAQAVDLGPTTRATLLSTAG